jgi:hypothetical protein
MLLAPSGGEYSTIAAKAKHHIARHLIGDGFFRDARFQDAHVANSDTKAGCEAGIRLTEGMIRRSEVAVSGSRSRR